MDRIDAILAMMKDRPTEVKKRLATGNANSLRPILMPYLNLDPETAAPDSQEAAEYATVDRMRLEAAYRLWATLTPQEQATLLELAEYAADDLADEMRLEAPSPGPSLSEILNEDH